MCGWYHKMCGKKKGTTECNESTVTCDVGTVQCEDGTIKCEKKIRELPNVTKIQSYVMLVLHNVKMETIKYEKKKSQNVTKILSNVMLVLSNVTI